MRLSEQEYATLLARGHVRAVGEKREPPGRDASSEKAFLERVRRLAHEYGYLTYHAHRSDKSEPGWPDLALCNGDSLILAELKSTSGKLTPEQARWLSMLLHAKVECYCWTPNDWDAIVERLTAPRAPSGPK